jgi:hypothetical protein
MQAGGACPATGASKMDEQQFRMWVACFSLLLAGVFAGWAHFTSCGLHPADARRAARLAMGGNIHFFYPPLCVFYT